MDVFFVISGFVITNLLTRERDLQVTLALRGFYWRRFKRLMPALALVVTTTALLATALLSPLGIQQNAAGTGIAAMLFSANIFISQTTGNYFDPSAETNPLLNTWSLSVEEQFYFIFPTLVLLAWAGSSRTGLRIRVASAVSLVAVLSLALTLSGAWFHVGTRLDLIVAPFYSPFTRAWEFAVGALVAVLGTRGVDRLLPLRTQNLAGLLGLLMIVAAGLGAGAEGPVPGFGTLLPVLGTALVILAGTHGRAPTSWVLSRRGMVLVGDWSYSIYLWHWPFIVFTAVLFPDSPLALVAAALISVGPALASYHFIEHPLRRARITQHSRRLLLVGIVMLVPVGLGLGSLFIANTVLRPQYESGQFRVLQGDLGPDSWRSFFTSTYAPCSSSALRAYVPDWEGREMCRQSVAQGPPSVAVIGDSHSQDMFVALAGSYPETNIVSLGFGGMAPSLRGSAEMQSALKAMAGDPSVKVVILAGKWNAYDDSMLEGVAESINLLSSAGKSVFITSDVPSFSFDPWQCAMRRVPALPGSRCEESSVDALKQDPAFDFILRLFAKAHGDVEIVALAPVFCDAKTCSMRKGDEVLYRDRDHLTIEGSQLIGSKLSKLSASLDAALSASG